MGDILELLELKILDWAEERKIVPNAKITTQALKLGSELGELAGHMATSSDIKDDVGDMVVVLIILNELAGNENYLVKYKLGCGISTEGLQPVLGLMKEVGNLQDNAIKGADIVENILSVYAYIIELCNTREVDLSEALEMAYNEIKDRKGITTEEGVFIKDTDPRYKELINE